MRLSLVRAPALQQGHRHGSQQGILGQNSQKTKLLKTEIPGSCPLSSKYLEFLSKKRLTTPKLTLLDRLLSLSAVLSQHFSVGFGRKSLGFDSCSFLNDKLTSSTVFF